MIYITIVYLSVERGQYAALADVSPQRLHFDRKHRRKIANNWGPAVSGIGGGVNLPAAGAEIHAALVERVDGHGVAQHVDVAVTLRQAFGQRLPFVSAGAAAEHAELAIRNIVLRVALDGDDVDRFGLVGVDVNHESEVGGQVATDFFPVVARVVRAHHVPVLLHEEHVRPFGMHGDVMHAVSDLGILVWDILRPQPAVDRLPSRASVVGAEGARRRDGYVHPPRITGIKNDGVQAHAARSRLPFGTGAVPAQAGEFLPVLATVGRAEDGGIFDAGVNRARIGE